MDQKEHIKNIKKLQGSRDAVLKTIYETAKLAFPVGSEVTFEKWGHFIWAEILDVNDGGLYEPRFFVRSHTGKEYWVDLFYLIGPKE